MEETDKKEQPPIADQVKDYIETYLKLARLKAIDKGTSLAAAIAVDIAMILAGFTVFLFASLSLAFFLSYILSSDWKGFGCVALLYLLIVIILVVFRKSFVRPVANILIKKLFK